MPFRMDREVESEGKIVNYRPDMANGRSNRGFTDLRGRPELAANIPEASTSPALCSLLVALSEPTSQFFSVGCEIGENAMSNGGWNAGGYVEIACKDFEIERGGHPLLASVAVQIWNLATAAAGDRLWKMEVVESPLDVSFLGACGKIVTAFAFNVFSAAQTVESARIGRDEQFLIIQNACQSNWKAS